MRTVVKRATRRWWVGVIWIVLPMLIGSFLVGSYAPTARGQTDTSFKTFLPSLNSGPQTTYLPLVTRARKSTALADLSVFSVELNRRTVSRFATQLAELRPDWVRYNGILWSAVEPRPGVRNWRAIELELNEIATIAATGAAPMVIIRSAPAWAQARPNTACGAIAPEALPAFADFVDDLVRKLSGHPYYVQYWEFGNEPDIDPNLIGGNSAYGCWGDANDEQGYGGAAYAEMLKVAYPAVKAANPQAYVVFGGILLDCDPSFRANCVSGNFLNGVLAAGGGDYFDIMAYHGYPDWSNVRVDTDLINGNWAHRGGLLLGKAQFIRETLAAYGYTKPLIMNEGGLLCFRSDPICAPNGLYTDQAGYAVRLYTRSMAAGIVMANWYTLNGPGWQDGGLIDAEGQPRPAYRAIQFLANRMRTAQFLRVSSTEVLESYVFRVGRQMYTVYWSNDERQEVITLPRRAVVYGPEGNRITVSGTTVTVGFDPVIVVHTP
jgi:hypothetical protein